MTATSKIGTTPAHWAARGFLVGVLVFAAANSLSYFVRSGGWGGALGREAGAEAIGFPLEIWNSGSRVLRLPAVAVNAAAMVGLGIAGGLCSLALTRPFNRLVREIEAELSERRTTTRPLQFTVRGLLWCTVGAALVAAMLRAPRVETLAAIYLLGPAALVVLALLPRGVDWRQRVWILAPLAVVLIALAIYIGSRPEVAVDFEKVLMGVAVSWTSQSVIAAFLIVLALLVWRRRTLFPPRG